MSKHSNPVMVSSEFLKVANVGLASAANAIKTVLNDEISMDVLWVGSMPTSSFGDVSGHADDLVIGAYVRVTGDALGHALLVFSEADTYTLADLAMGLPVGTTRELGEMEQSVVQEIANILTSSYLTAIADFYHITMLPDPPLVAVDMAGAIVGNVLASSGRFEPETLSIVTQFRIRSQTMNGFFLYIPEARPVGESEAA